MPRFFRTKFTMEILSEGEFGDALSLEQIAWAISEGDCVGRLSADGVDALTPKGMADALIDLGSEPGFFQLDDDGKSL